MSRTVLIADGNAGRGRRLAQACESAGISCRLASQGVAALELALAQQPQLIVTECDLPLVDAWKLAEILRANPRTRRVRLLFLGEEESVKRRVRAGDWWLPIATATDTLVGEIDHALQRQGRIDDLEENAEGEGEIAGELGQLPLADLLQLFHVNQRSGLLTLQREPEEGVDPEGVVLIRDGDIIRAEVGSAEGEKALFRLLSWPIGRFSFEPAPCIESPRIFAPTRALLAEGQRQLEEWDRLAPRLPPLDSPLKLRVKTSELPNIVHPLTQEVLLLLEIYPRVRDVVDNCSFPDYQVLRTLHTLAERGIVQLGRVPIAGPAPMSEGLFNDDQARRLREWLKGESPREGATADAKLIVVASESDGLQDFANLLAASPDVTLASREGADGLGLLGSVGRVRVDDEAGIEIFHLPSEERYAPLWPVVTHDALAVLFLLSGTLGEAASRVRGISAMVAGQPKVRGLHVALLRKQERLSPDELREHSELIDESALYLLALESGKEALALLRGLFARVVP